MWNSVCGIIYNDHPYYFRKNLQGDVIAITEWSGETVARYTYDAWGKCTIVDLARAHEIATVNPFRYRGYYYDSETALYYLQSRYYDPELGRFLNGDDVAYALIAGKINGHHLYAYYRNDLINFSDATGFQPKWAQAVTRYVKGTLAYKTSLHATQKGWFADLFWATGFFRTSDGVYHTRQDCWQRFFGYNDFYDWAFILGTSMLRAKFPCVTCLSKTQNRGFLCAFMLWQRCPGNGP